ncbi:MAG: hypothetical protein Q9208_007105 [Pyrenodesmia sp. 3 TL-2023]
MQGFDLGPCGNPYISYPSLFLLLVLVALMGSAGYSKINRSKRGDQANVRPDNRISVPNGRNEESRVKLQAWMQERHDEPLRRTITTRVATDISGQLTQLSRRMSELRAQMLSTQEEWSSIVATCQNVLRLPYAAHVRDRVGEWEHYESGSPATSTDTSLDRASSNTQRTGSEEAELYTMNPWNTDEVLTPLPVYASKDPLAAHCILPAYSS